LVSELRDHVEDAITDEVAAGRSPRDAEHATLSRLGSPTAIAGPWHVYVQNRRRETRKRAGLVTLAAATACALAVAQHASGLREPNRPCTTPTPTQHVSGHNPVCASPPATANGH
jgi:uncharacterized protein with von Willebrand factor type A (vWA) domain